MTPQWRSLARPWHDTNVSHCDVCGRLLPARAWVFQAGGRTVDSCGPDCQELYETYVGPLREMAEAHAHH
jgi:hypothetical protein